MSKDTFYFSHDYNARNDEKIKLLIRKHGMNGYGIFWSIVEDLYNNANALRLDFEGIAFDLRTDKDIVKSIINDFDLFVIEGGNFGSLSIQKRLEERNEKSKKAQTSALKRWANKRVDANALQTQYECNAINKGKERKEKEIKETEEIKESFELFWNLYDKKVGSKIKLLAKWIKLSDDDRAKIFQHVPKYVLSQPDKKYRKNVETYLNNFGWKDEIIISKDAEKPQEPQPYKRHILENDF